MSEPGVVYWSWPNQQVVRGEDACPGIPIDVDDGGAAVEPEPEGPVERSLAAADTVTEAE